jgi:hypothetical protein
MQKDHVTMLGRQIGGGLWNIAPNQETPYQRITSFIDQQQPTSFLFFLFLLLWRLEVAIWADVGGGRYAGYLST